jgi:hypothetical protein
MAKKSMFFTCHFKKLFVIWTSKFVMHEGLMTIMAILSNWEKEKQTSF